MKQIPYSYSELNDLHSKINNVKALTEPIWKERIAYLGSLYLYLSYAEAQSRIINETDWEYLNKLASSNHSKYADLQYKYFSSAIAFYEFAKTCINFLKKLTNNMPSEYDGWIKETLSKRDRLSGHPDELNYKKGVTHKRGAVSSNGWTEFRVLDLTDASKSHTLRAEPVNDIQKLKLLVAETAKRLNNEWQV